MSKDELYMMRRKKKIKLREIADYLNCSIAYVSYYENDNRSFDREKTELYTEFIINYVPIKK